MRRPWGAAWAIGLLATQGLLAVVGVAILFGVAGYRKGKMPGPSDIPFESLLLADLTAKLLAVGALFAAFHWRKQPLGLQLPDPSPRRSLAGGLLAGLAFLPPVMLAGMLQDWIYVQAGWKFSVQDIIEQAKVCPVPSFALIAAFAVLAAPPFEELAFRGFLHSGLRVRLGPVPASLVTAALFALFHLEIDALPLLFLLGLLLSWLRERTGGLSAPIAAHACYNAFQMVGVWMMRHGG